MNKHADNLDESGAAALKETTAVYGVARSDGVYRLRTPEDRGWEEFRDQCRRQMQRPIELRIRYGFARRIRRGDNAGACRAYDSTAEYRAWCEANLPDYRGFKRSRQ